MAGLVTSCDDRLQREQIDLAGLEVEPRLQVLAGLVVLARGGRDRFFDGADDDIGLDAFFFRQRLDRLLQRIRHVTPPPRPQNSTSRFARVIDAERHPVAAAVVAVDQRPSSAVSTPAEPALEEHLAVDRLAHHQLGPPAREAPVVVGAAQRPVEPRRRHLQRVRRRHDVLDVEHGAQIAADPRAILDADALLGRRRRARAGRSARAAPSRPPRAGTARRRSRARSVAGDPRPPSSAPVRRRRWRVANRRPLNKKSGHTPTSVLHPGPNPKL